MANRKAQKRKNQVSERDDLTPAQPGEDDLERVVVDTRDQQLAELKEITRSLLSAVQEVRAQSARNDAVRTALDDVKADVRAASQAMMLSPSGTSVTPVGTHPTREGACGPCECVDVSCCCFEIRASMIRATQPQIELPDIGDVPLPIPTINPLEVQAYITVDRIGFLTPGLASTFDLRAEGFPGGPGPWVVLERVINRVYVKKGATVTKRVEVEVREHDEGVERPLAFKDEIGQSFGMITLNCCMDEIYPPLPIDIPLKYGGEGGGTIQLAFYARRVCC